MRQAGRSGVAVEHQETLWKPLALQAVWKPKSKERAGDCSQSGCGPNESGYWLWGWDMCHRAVPSLLCPTHSKSSRTHHVLRDKHVEIQAVFADSRRRGPPGTWLQAAGPAEVDV